MLGFGRRRVTRDALSTPRKTAGPTPCRFRFLQSTIPNPGLLLVDRLFQFGPWSELRHLPGSDLNRGARLRVASVPGFPLRHRECSETNQCYPIAFPQRTRNAVHSGINRSRSRRFVHSLSSQVSFVPSAHGGTTSCA